MGRLWSMNRTDIPTQNPPDSRSFFCENCQLYSAVKTWFGHYCRRCGSVWCPIPKTVELIIMGYDPDFVIDL